MFTKPLQSSMALAMKLTVAPQASVSLFTVTAAGKLSTGAVISFTVISWVAVWLLPAASVADHVLVIV